MSLQIREFHQPSHTAPHCVEYSPELKSAPSIVHEALRSPGQPLDMETRAYMEPRFGHDFSHVRIHTDTTDAESAEAVNAMAYTVGQEIVFNFGAYNPHSVAGLGLLAHELAHTTQTFPGLARACLESAVCDTVMTPIQLLAAARTPANQTRREQRESNCTQDPPAQACRGDGHAARATEAETLLRHYDPARMQNVQGIFVDRDIEGDFGALTIACADFIPPLAPSGHCIAIPRPMEENARIFNTTTGPMTIGGMERGLWRERTLEILSHEARHVDFRTSYMSRFVSKLSTSVPDIMGRRRPSCNRDTGSRWNVFQSANELTAMVQEFPLRMEYISISVRLASPEAREAELEAWRSHRLLGTRQSITNSLRVIRCLCGCRDANNIIREAIEFATNTWSQSEKDNLNREMTDTRWDSLDLRWPFSAPSIP